jgi:hypothetical protein
MRAVSILILVISVGLLMTLGAVAVEKSSAGDATSVQERESTSQTDKPESVRDAVATPNALVNIASAPGTEQVNSSVAYSEIVAGEVYGVWTEFIAPGPSPTMVGWSPSFASGAPGTWVPVPPNPPPPGFSAEWNPDIASNPTGGFLMVSSAHSFPPYVPGANGIIMTPTVGGGAPFAGPILIMINAPGFNWFDYPVNVFDEDPASPNFATCHMAWSEYIDGDGDPDFNGNFYDDAGDGYFIWTSYTNFAAGPFPFPLFSAPLANGGGPLFINSMQMHRPAIDVSWSGQPAVPLPPGAAYVAWIDLAAGTIMLDASELVTAAIPWGALGAGIPVATVPIVPFGSVIAPGIKASSSVSLAIHNEPGDPCDGNIYLAWADGAGPDVDILFSADLGGGGLGPWTPPIPVHTVLPPGHQWAPSMTVDPLTGHICIIYYDQRTAPGLIETWASISVDCGVTWTDFPLSDAGPTPPVTSIVTPPGPYVGDYLGSDVNIISSMGLSGAFGGIWNDGRNGVDQDIYFDPDCNCCNHDGIRGDANYDFAGPNIADLTYLVDYLFRGGPPPPCPEEGDANGDGAGPNVADLTYLVDFLFRVGPAPPPCP